MEKEGEGGQGLTAPFSELLIEKDLRRWFKEKWVDVSRKDKDGKHPPCGRSEADTSSRGYPKCRPSKKVSGDTPQTVKATRSRRETNHGQNVRLRILLHTG